MWPTLFSGWLQSHIEESLSLQVLIIIALKRETPVFRELSIVHCLHAGFWLAAHLVPSQISVEYTGLKPKGVEILIWARTTA